MAVANCPRCGKIFDNENSVLCIRCVKQDDADFLVVRNYVVENKKALIAEIVEETGVSAKKIQRFVRDGRLEESEGISQDNISTDRAFFMSAPSESSASAPSAEKQKFIKMNVRR